MPNPIVLAAAQLGHDTLTIELAGDRVIVTWPGVAMHVSAAKFPDTAATLTRLFANASTELARLKAGRKR